MNKYFLFIGRRDVPVQFTTIGKLNQHLVKYAVEYKGLSLTVVKGHRLYLRKQAFEVKEIEGD